MKNNPSILLTLVIAILATSCQQTGRDEITSATEADKWFEGKTWLGDVTLMPDPAINRTVFYEQYHQNQDLWDKAFAYMASVDLDTLAVGEYPVAGNDLFVKVSEYQTVESHMKNFESHRQYTDIQFVVAGSEYIGLDERDQLSVEIPYNEAEDIEFYKEKGGQNLLAQPGTFFIFFPSDAHRMGLDVEGSASSVKKVVIKLRNKA